MMPEMDGYEVCRRLKAEDKTKEIPVIFITAKSEVQDETKGFELGAVDYITKPFMPTIVQARVKTHLELKSARENIKEHARLLSLPSQSAGNFLMNRKYCDYSHSKKF